MVVRRVLLALASVAIAASCGTSKPWAAPATPPAVPATTGTAPGSAPPPFSAPISAASLAADEATVDKVILRPSDLPAGWTLVQDEVMTTDLNSPSDACHPAGLFSQHTAGRHREWSYLLDSNGLESGHLAVTVKVARTAAVVTRQLALFNSAQDPPCEAQAIEADLASGGATVTGKTTWIRLPWTSPVPGGGERFTTPFRFNTDKVKYTDYFWFGLGRVRVALWPEGCCNLPSPQLERDLIATLGARLRAAVNG